MALLFPQCCLPFSPSICSNKASFVVRGRQQTKFNLIKHDQRQPRRHDKNKIPIPIGDDDGVPGAIIVPADYPSIKRSDFPVDFKFGASVSALQSEGPADIGGRGPSTWDFLLTQDGYNSTSLSYLNYKEDVQLLKKMGMDVYRFSISWSRILPNGTGEINDEGIKFYNNLIDELLANGIEPFVTLFHMDVPKALQDKYNGFLGSEIVEDFKSYSDICFKNFGDRVKYWGTINEPDVYAQYGYLQGLPVEDDPARNPYIAARNIILAHATAAKHYKKNYQASQGGIIGMTVSLIWFEPYSNSKQDKEAAARALAFHTDLFVEPLVYGEYPFIVKSLARDRLPEFTAQEKELVKGSYDFIGINYYTSRYAKALPISPNDVPVSFDGDQYLELKADLNGKPIGEKIAEDIYMAPDGLRDGLLHLKESYYNPAIYITENGVVDLSGKDRDVTDDGHRITFISNHLKAVKEALWKDVNVKSYIVWSHIDVVELGGGYNVRLGLNYIDYNNFNRIPKKSANWFSKFLNKSTEDKAN